MKNKTIQIQINEKYLNLVPRPEDSQINSLKNSIQEDSQQVKIIVNSKGMILDGHTRFMICDELGIVPEYVIKKFVSIEKEKEFVVSANLNRRQLTLFERGEILFAWWKEERQRSNSKGGYATHATRRTGVTHGGTVTGKKERLLQRFARIIGTNATNAHELTWLMLHAPENTKVKLRKEEMTIRAAYIELAKPIRKFKQDYIKEDRIYLKHPNCLNCQAPTVDVKNDNCHVHTILCCTKCGWGN